MEKTMKTKINEILKQKNKEVAGWLCGKDKLNDQERQSILWTLNSYYTMLDEDIEKILGGDK